jgi:hypothetical protein
MLGRHAPVFVAGHRGLVGSAIVRRLEADGFTDLRTVGREVLDLRDQSAVDSWFDVERPRYVFLVAGTVGGIHANTSRPAEFLYDNLMIHGTVVQAAHRIGVEKPTPPVDVRLTTHRPPIQSQPPVRTEPLQVRRNTHTARPVERRLQVTTRKRQRIRTT